MHGDVQVFGGECQRSRKELGRGHEARSAANQVRVFARDPERHEAAHGNAGNATVFPVRYGTEGRVDVLDQLGEIQGKLTVRLHGAYVVRPQGILGTRIDAVPLHDDEIHVRSDIIGQSIGTVPGISRVIITDFRRSPVIALCPSVKEIQHWIQPGVSLSVSCLIVIGRQENTEEPLLGLAAA